MKVADLYIAMCLIGACALAGWKIHEWVDDHERELEEVRKLNTHIILALPPETIEKMKVQQTAKVGHGFS